MRDSSRHDLQAKQPRWCGVLGQARSCISLVHPAFRTTDAEVTSLSGDVLAVIPIFPLMLWEELRSNFSDMLQISTWEAIQV